MYDICIVGAGPAGATLARMIGPQFRVLLIDRRRLDQPSTPRKSAQPRSELRDAGLRDLKPCGGLLAPKAQRELARQGLGLPGSVVVGPQLFAVRTLDLATSLERIYQRFYVNVDRDLFDRWLVSLLPARVDTAFGYRVSDLEVGPEGSLVRLGTERGGRASVVARLVAGADGAMSAVRRLAFPDRRQLTRYAAIQAAFTGVTSAPFYGAIFDRSLTDFYGWTIPKGGLTLVGMALRPGQGARATFETFVSRARAAGFCRGEELYRHGATVVRPHTVADLLCGEGDIALLGEAAGFVSPSSAEGISYALRSGRLLAAALRPGLAGATERYAASALSMRIDIALRVAKSTAIYSRSSRRLLMASGLGAMRVPAGGAPLARWADTPGF